MRYEDGRCLGIFLLGCQNNKSYKIHARTFTLLPITIEFHDITSPATLDTPVIVDTVSSTTTAIMKFLSTFVTTALLVSSTLAAPRTLKERVQARTSSRQSNPNQRIATSDADQRTLTNIQYSNNWAGAVYEQPPPEGSCSYVSGTFTVPEPKAVGEVKEGSVTAGSAWVGIDGDTYGAAILQTGVDFYVEADGNVHYDAWYEWYPDYAYDFEVKFKAGDVVNLAVEAYASSWGYVQIENLSTGETAMQILRAPTEKAVLAGENAEWIIEDFQSGGELVNLVDFGTVTFTDTQAQAGHKVYGVKDASIIELKQGDNVITETTIVSDEEFNVKYTG